MLHDIPEDELLRGFGGRDCIACVALDQEAITMAPSSVSILIFASPLQGRLHARAGKPFG